MRRNRRAAGGRTTVGSRRPSRHTLRLGLALGLVVALGATGAIGQAMAAGSHGAPQVAAQPRPGPRADAGAGRQTVGFTVRPTILVVVDEGCRPLALWSNIGHTPDAGQLAATQGRLRSASGDSVSRDCVRAALAALPMADVGWTVRGRVWIAG
jgi:hypothetical protein